MGPAYTCILCLGTVGSAGEAVGLVPKAPNSLVASKRCTKGCPGDNEIFIVFEGYSIPVFVGREDSVLASNYKFYNLLILIPGLYRSCKDHPDWYCFGHRC